MGRSAVTLFLIMAMAIPAIAATKDDEAVRSVLLLNARAFEQKDMRSLDRIWAHDGGQRL